MHLLSSSVDYVGHTPVAGARFLLTERHLSSVIFYLFIYF